MADPFSRYPNNVDGPAKKAFAITPTDSVEMVSATKSLYVGGAGDINCILVGDTANTLFSTVQSGTILPIRVKVVHATGTSATALVGLA